MKAPEIIPLIRNLKPWPFEVSAFVVGDFQAYEKAAATLQAADTSEVSQALQDFRDSIRPDDPESDALESRVFLLLRFVFDLPEEASLAQRRIFKGWANWPAPGPDGKVSLSWPLSFKGKSPQLLSGRAGSQGQAYAIEAEYQHFLDHFSYRT